MGVKIASVRGEAERVLFLSDIHVPHQDAVAVKLTLEFAKWWRPHHLFLIGDVVDFYQMSRYDQDPKRTLLFQDDMDEAASLLADVRRAIGKNCKITFREGNHEYRLTRYLWAHPQISNLRSVQLPEILDFAKLGIRHVDYFGKLEHGGLLIEHGDICRKHSAYTACGMLDKRGRSGISGHCHRLGVHYRSDEAGDRAWFENGCLCSRKTTYSIGTASWQHGFTAMRFLKNRFAAVQVPIVGKKLFFEERLFSAS